LGIMAILYLVSESVSPLFSAISCKAADNAISHRVDLERLRSDQVSLTR
jgi:hypothetical protein